MGRCPFCSPLSGSTVLHDCPRCWVKRNKDERASYTAICKAHGRQPSREEIIHMKRMLIRQKEGWYRRKKMEFVQKSGRANSGLIGGHYFLQFKPKGGDSDG